jgi:glycosyltransferase involved in cell wall biosynthesis
VYKRQAVESVLNQTFHDFEILVMDDGSTDDTASVIASFSDNRILYAWDSNFGGPSRPRNKGISLARGKWVCFLDADDWWSVNKLQTCFDSISNDVDLIYHDLEVITDPPHRYIRKFIRSRQLSSSVLLDLLLNGNCIANSSVVVRKTLLNKIGGVSEHPDMVAAEDYNTWLRIAKFTNNFLYLQYSLGYYLMHDEGISRKDMSLSTAVAVAEFLPSLTDDQKKKIEIGLSYLNGRFSYLTKKKSQANKSLSTVLRYGYSKFFFKALLMKTLIAFKN